MTRLVEFFFDTYALIERQLGNAAYRPYAESAVFTHQSNLYEFLFAATRATSEARALEQVRLLAPNLVTADLGDLLEAVRYKLKRIRMGISYVDALGYVLALRTGRRFLTGDAAFRGEPNVEYVP